MNDAYLNAQSDFGNAITALLNKYGVELQDLTTVNVVISHKHDKPAVFLRRNTTSQPVIKQLIKAAYHNQPVIIMPQFSNTMQSISTAIEKGILIKDGNQYYFTW